MVKNIEELLNLPFSKRTKEEQLQIISEGKPKPKLPENLFNGAQKLDYELELWITACDKRFTLYCWPCLLFMREYKSVWTTTGYSCYASLLSGISEHNSKIEHIGGLLKWEYLVHENIAPENATAKQDYILVRLLRLICCVVSQNSRPPEDVENFHLHMVGRCTEALNLFRKGEFSSSEQVVDSISEFAILESFLRTLSDVVRFVIQEEVRNAPFVSLIMSEHSREESTENVSVVFRYLNSEDKVCERFVGFYSLQSSDFKRSISCLLLEYGLEDKVIAFSFDGTIESSDQLQDFATYMRENHGSLFVPCYFHRFKDIIERSVSNADSLCASFFRTIRAVKKYFDSIPKIQSVFKNSISHLNTCFDFNVDNIFPFIVFFKEHFKDFFVFFDSVINNDADWMPEDVVKAMEFQTALADVRILFLLELFFTMANFILHVDDPFNSDCPKILFELKYRSRCLANLKDIKGKSWSALWIAASQQSKLFSSSSDPNIKQSLLTCVGTYNTILDQIEKQIKLRIEPLEELDFCNLLHPGNSDLIRSGRFLLKEKRIAIVNEITGLKVFNLHFDDASVHKFLRANNLQDKFQNTYKLAKTILTLPCKPVFPDETCRSATESSASSQIPANADNSANSKPSSKLSIISSFFAVVSVTEDIICIENDIVTSLAHHNHFYREVFLRLFKQRNPVFKDDL